MSRAFAEITEAQLLPRIVRLRPNLYGAVFSLMKLVPARHILRKAMDCGELDRDTVIVETTSGTFGLALAMQAALLNRRLVLVSDPVIDRHLHRRLTDLGAVVEIVPHPARSGGFQQSRLDRVAQIRAERESSFSPEQYSNPDNPASYSTVADHLVSALGSVDCIVGPVGSGGSMCGTARGLRTVNPGTVAVAVDTHQSVLFGQKDGHRALRGLGNSLLPPNLDHTVFDEVHWCNEAESYAATRRLHRTTALFQGPTSGAAVLVGEWWADRNPDGLCVVMLPDDGYRYQETVYNDEWLAERGIRLTGRTTEPRPLDAPREPHPDWSRFRWARRDYHTVLAEVAA